MNNWIKKMEDNGLFDKGVEHFSSIHSAIKSVTEANECMVVFSESSRDCGFGKGRSEVGKDDRLSPPLNFRRMLLDNYKGKYLFPIGNEHYFFLSVEHAMCAWSLISVGRINEGMALALDSMEDLTLETLLAEEDLTQYKKWDFLKNVPLSCSLSVVEPQVLVHLRNRRVNFFPKRTDHDSRIHTVFLYCKFIQNPELLFALVSTGNAWLVKYTNSTGPVERWRHLEELRKAFTDTNSKAVQGIVDCVNDMSLFVV